MECFYASAIPVQFREHWQILGTLFLISFIYIILKSNGSMCMGEQYMDMDGFLRKEPDLSAEDLRFSFPFL